MVGCQARLHGGDLSVALVEGVEGVRRGRRNGLLLLRHGKLLLLGDLVHGARGVFSLVRLLLEVEINLLFRRGCIVGQLLRHLLLEKAACQLRIHEGNFVDRGGRTCVVLQFLYGSDFVVVAAGGGCGGRDRAIPILFLHGVLDLASVYHGFRL